jgi:hypothetical protein
MRGREACSSAGILRVFGAHAFISCLRRIRKKRKKDGSAEY